MKKFIQGIIFISLFLPLSQTFIDIVNQSAKLLCTWLAVKTVEIEKTLDEGEEEEIPDKVVGFRIPNPKSEEEEEEEWDEDEDYDE